MRSLLAFARFSLYLPPDDTSTLPLDYLAQLDAAFDDYDELNFMIRKEEGQGYGTATCLDCQIDIKLAPTVALADGGVERGLGSIKPVQKHLATSEHGIRRAALMDSTLVHGEERMKIDWEASAPNPSTSGPLFENAGTPSKQLASPPPSLSPSSKPSSLLSTTTNAPSNNATQSKYPDLGFSFDFDIHNPPTISYPPNTKPDPILLANIIFSQLSLSSKPKTYWIKRPVSAFSPYPGNLASAWSAPPSAPVPTKTRSPTPPPHTQNNSLLSAISNYPSSDEEAEEEEAMEIDFLELSISQQREASQEEDVKPKIERGEDLEIDNLEGSWETEVERSYEDIKPDIKIKPEDSDDDLIIVDQPVSNSKRKTKKLPKPKIKRSISDDEADGVIVCSSDEDVKPKVKSSILDRLKQRNDGSGGHEVRAVEGLFDDDVEVFNARTSDVEGDGSDEGFVKVRVESGKKSIEKKKKEVKREEVVLSSDDEEGERKKPSKKALGKRKAITLSDSDADDLPLFIHKRPPKTTWSIAASTSSIPRRLSPSPPPAPILKKKPSATEVALFEIAVNKVVQDSKLTGLARLNAINKLEKDGKELGLDWRDYRDRFVVKVDRKPRLSGGSEGSGTPAPAPAPNRFVPKDKEKEKEKMKKKNKEPGKRKAKENVTALDAARVRNVKWLEEQVKRKKGLQPGKKLREPSAGLAGGVGIDGEARLNGQAPDMDEEEFRANRIEVDAFMARADREDYKGNVDIEKAMKKLGLKDRKEAIPGMTCHLLPFQILSVAWMSDREMNEKSPGGLLLDEMGLGKTVSTMATMMYRRSEDPDIKTNLIVVPLALLSQWEDEIRTKCGGHLKTHIYHGSNKHKVKKVEDLKRFDVVITTHDTLKRELPNADSEPGILFQMLFYRIICDEAQIIRNRKTQVSKAIIKIDAVYRWALTGTPVTNSLADIHPLVRFLRYKPWSDWKHFNEVIVKKEKTQPVDMAKIGDAVLAEVSLRRSKSDTLEGKPLVDLKPMKLGLTVLEFDAEERAAYDIAEKNAQLIISKYFKKGTLLKNWNHIFVLILRLRQLTIHPSFIAEESSLVQFMKELERAVKHFGEVKLAAIKAKRLEIAVARFVSVGAKEDENDVDDGSCPVCFDGIAPGTGTLLGCAHVFCVECAEGVLNGPAIEIDAEDRQYKKDERPCPQCRAPFSADTMFDLDVFEPTEKEIETEAAESKVVVLDISDDEEDLPDLKEAIRRFGDRKPNIKAEFAVKEGKEPFVKGEKKARPPLKKKAKLDFALPSVVPSAKMRYVLAKLRDYELENPAIKTIIISSFTSALDLVDNYLTHNGVPCVRFQGSSSQDERKAAIKQLKDDPDTRVMLLSLKAGGVGLNLVMACRVLSLDLSWNLAGELQSWSRVHRLGQNEEVIVERLTCDDTIEQRIDLLQKRKVLLSDISLKEGQGHPDFKGKITVPEILGLFKLDKHGNPLHANNGRKLFGGRPDLD